MLVRRPVQLRCKIVNLSCNILNFYNIVKSMLDLIPVVLVGFTIKLCSWFVFYS